ncbi:MAG: hypothetical protein EOP40_05265 [Rubrivivax sp.]|nr:MAG: hypothetical protein EOP40_05265 [Rubrivivax sp.]
MPRHSRQLAAALLCALASAGAAAVETSWSAFGTLGAAVSDQEWTYARHVDDRGTVKRDTVLGAQLDTHFTPAWSATLQAKVAPSLREEDRWDVTASWAFVSWRPSNEWLVRAGKLRVPLYLFSENLDVGQSYDFARMPAETYAIAPTTDMQGLYVTRSWVLPDSEVNLDLVAGRARVYHRFYTRDQGPAIDHVHTGLVGGALSWRKDDLTLRAGFGRATTRLGPSLTFPVSVRYTELNPQLPGFGAYLPTSLTNEIVNDIVALGMDWQVVGGWRVLAEYVHNMQHKTRHGFATQGGHLAVLKSTGRWTPYVVASALKSDRSQKRIRQALEGVRAPAYVPEAIAAPVEASQRILADVIPYHDQYTLAVGTSFALNPHSKIKVEWAHTRIQSGSAFVDSPRGGPPVSHQGVNVLTLNYNFAF